MAIVEMETTAVSCMVYVLNIIFRWLAGQRNLGLGNEQLNVTLSHLNLDLFNIKKTLKSEYSLKLLMACSNYLWIIM
jgi:hypothetical protein